MIDFSHRFFSNKKAKAFLFETLSPKFLPNGFSLEIKFHTEPNLSLPVSSSRNK